MKQPVKCADTMVREYRELNPGERITRNVRGTAIGVWIESVGRFVTFGATTITGQWVIDQPGRFPNINGKPAVADSEWVPITEGA